MGKFNEIQKGMPDLGNTYWQDLKSGDAKETPVAEVVEINCRTIFSPENSKNTPGKPSIF